MRRRKVLRLLLGLVIGASAALPFGAAAPLFLPLGGSLVPPAVAARGDAGLLLRLEEGFVLWDRTLGTVRPLPLDPRPKGPAFGVLRGGDLYLAVDEAFAGGGLWRYDLATGKGTAVPLPEAVREEFAREERALSAYPSEGPVRLRYCGLLDGKDRLFLAVAGSGLLEWRPEAGTFRPLFAGAVREAVGPQPCPCPSPLGRLLFVFTPRGPLILDPDAGSALLLVPREVSASPDGFAGVDREGLSLLPADLGREEAEALADLASTGSPPVPLPTGLFLGDGLFLEKGELAYRPPWPSAWLEEPEEGISAAAAGGTLTAVFNALCGEEGRSFLLRTADGGRRWEALALRPPQGRSGSFALLEATETNLLLAFRDEEGGGDSFLVLPLSSAVFGPLPRGPCGTGRKPPEGEEEALPGFTRRRLWTGPVPRPAPPPPATAAPSPPAPGTATPPKERPAQEARRPSA